MRTIPVIRHKMDIPYTDIIIWFPGGVVSENEKESGFAHFSEHLIFKMSHGGKRPADFVEELGGSINAWTSMDFVALTVTVMNRYVPDVISYFQNLLSFDFSTVSEEDFKEERSVVIEEKLMYHDDPVERLVLEVRKKVYGDHPYGRDISGEVNVLSNATQNGLETFYRESLIRSPFVTCVGGYDGNFSLSLPVSMKKVPTKVFKKRAGEKFVIENRTEKYYFMAGWAFPYEMRSMVMTHLIKTMLSSLSSAEFYNRLVFEDRIFDELLVETLTANTSLFFGHLGVFSGDRRSERLEKWLSLWDNYVFSMDEFSKVVELFIRKRRLFAENPEIISDSMGKSFFIYGEPQKLNEKYLSTLYDINLDELNSFKQDMLGFDNLTLGVSVPESEKHFNLNTVKRGDLKKRSLDIANYVHRKSKKAVLSVLKRNSPEITLYLMKKAGVAMEKEGKSGVSGLFMRCLGASCFHCNY
ncbi:MAG: insulinase family protein [bacterium]